MHVFFLQRFTLYTVPTGSYRMAQMAQREKESSKATQ